jgi:hypothetical protein
MIGENEDINTWKNNILNAIKDISDIEFQREAWLGKNPNIVSSYDEVINTLYDDNDFERYIEHYKSLNGNTVLYRLLNTLNRLINDYNIKSVENDSIILEDPKWIDITEKAKEIISLLK